MFALYLSEDNIHYCDWTGNDPDKRLVLQALTGRLGQERHKILDGDLTSEVVSAPESRWIIGGYSGGGWIVYQWLLESREERIKKTVPPDNARFPVDLVQRHSIHEVALEDVGHGEICQNDRTIEHVRKTLEAILDRSPT